MIDDGHRASWRLPDHLRATLISYVPLIVYITICLLVIINKHTPALPRQDRLLHFHSTLHGLTD